MLAAALTRGSRLAGGAAAVLLAALCATAQAAAAAPATAASGTSAAASGAGQGKLAVLDLVVLVDESGSETPQKVADEKATTGIIVQSLLNPASRVTVVGFGGNNGVTTGQVPTDVACVPTIASGSANLGYLSSCVSKLHRRTEAEGDDTDYAAALGQAMSYLSPSSTATPPSPPGAIKVILMMTDGAVDVQRDAQYGTTPAARQAAEQTAISQQLSEAKADGVQFWPLGFGTDIGNVDGTSITQAQAKSYLDGMAKEGAPTICGGRPTAIQPHATWVNNPDDAINALGELYADAACVGRSISQGPLGGGISSATLAVSIPEIASAAAISVDRGSTGVSVTFDQPDGTQWTDASAISGQDTPVEVLHLDNITQADVGTWRIHLSAPPSLASEVVRATAFWQGAVRALITANPPSAKLGQQVKVTLDVLGANGPVTDPATLASLVVGVTATGNGLPGTVSVPVSPVSGAPGQYTGTIAAPSQPTTLTVTGTASGYGLYATQVPATVGVGTQTQGFTATPGFSGQASAQAGGTITGQVAFTNQTGSARQVRLVLASTGASAALTSPAGVISVPAGSPPSVPFTITVGKSSPPGIANLQVRVVDAASGTVYNTAEQDFTITTPPGFFARYKWALLGLLALIILAGLVWVALWKASRDRRDVRHLVAMLRRGGTAVGRDLEPEGKWAESFPFIIRDEASAAPRLDHPPRGASVGIYQVRRAGRGLVRLITPTGQRPYEIEVGGAGLEMGNGLEVAFRDTRHPEWAGSGRPPAGQAPPPPGGWNGSGGPGVPAGSGAASSADDWGGSGGWGGAGDWSGSGSPTITTPPPPAPAPPPGYDQGGAPTTPIKQAPPPPDPWL